MTETQYPMITTAEGFQYSVNIAFDLQDKNKLKNFIPTKSSLKLLEEILLSTRPESTSRSRILIGAYGKGKSHIVLTILSLLNGREKKDFVNLNKKLETEPRLQQLIENYRESKTRLLPVIISGSNTSLTQAFILSLQRTLSLHGLLDIMPETNYKAAVQTIGKWQTEYPETYQNFQKILGQPIASFISDLSNYDIEAYRTFEKLYPQLTSGSSFNPFLGFDVVELYENVVTEIQKKGYNGIYVVYDEFSKYLEANITQASVSDTKMLQDFAEKCNRSASKQLHLILISHKEIGNYIDRLPKQKVDGWRGISERFQHVLLNNNFSQTYEIIATVIEKEKALWQQFIKTKQSSFEQLIVLYKGHQIFWDMEENSRIQNIYDCYPLHPVSTFILPRLSERIAQNERTLFTFLSATGTATLPNFLQEAWNAHGQQEFNLVTPDLIYDYFEPLLKKEAYSESIHNQYILTSRILEKLENSHILDRKIVKTISLIYLLEQYEKLKPTTDEIVNVFQNDYTNEEITAALNRLEQQELVLYLRKSNSYLKLKETVGVDIHEQIYITKEKLRKTTMVKDILTECNVSRYLYPSCYNDKMEMTRYFSFQFINAKEVQEDTNWAVKSEGIQADGIVYAILPSSEEELSQVQQLIQQNTQETQQILFILPKFFSQIEEDVLAFKAVNILKANATEDRILHDEYEIIYDDLQEIIIDFIQSFTHPERGKALYLYRGEIQDIRRKAQLSDMLSDICFQVFCNSPIINNESINKNDITGMAYNSRNKLLHALLRNQLEKDLGLAGSGQEVSIMRSTLQRTGIWDNENLVLSLKAQKEPTLQPLLDTIQDFVLSTRSHGKQCFSVLYDKLTAPKHGIGARKGIIPIYIAVVFHGYKKEIAISNDMGQVPLNVDTLIQLTERPEKFFLSYTEWDNNKESYIQELDKIFQNHIYATEKESNSYDYIVTAMYRWYLGLPRYVKEVKKLWDGTNVSKEISTFLKLVKQNNEIQSLLFEKLPKLVAPESVINQELARNVGTLKNDIDGLIQRFKNYLRDEIKSEFATPSIKDTVNLQTLTSVIKDWCNSLDATVFNQIFPNGTNRCLTLFSNITNNEEDFIEQLAKLTTGFRIEDWNDKTFDSFKEKIKEYKETALSFKSQSQDNSQNTGSYEISVISASGDKKIQRFEKIDVSKKGELLYNRIVDNLAAMGQAISEQEKRQIIMRILQELCK